jgi:GAF domain-containing protein
MAQPSELFAAVAKAMNAPATLAETLRVIAESAKISVPGSDHVGVSVAHRDGRMETLAATDDFTLRLDELQYDLQEGPCVHAMRGHGVTLVEDASRETRWPRYMAAAVSMGLRSQMGVEMHLDDRSVGGLNFYSVDKPLRAEDVEDAKVFATHAAIAMRRAAMEDGFRAALDSRTVIGQATGMVMQRYGLDSERAFEFLVRTSSHRNTKLVQVAREIVASGFIPAGDYSVE